MIDGKQVLCINYIAYAFTTEDNMVAIQDIIREFSLATTLTECTEVFSNVLSVTVFKANW